MAGGYGYLEQKHQGAWEYLRNLEPDIALLQEAVPPAWAGEEWSIVTSPRYTLRERPGSTWGSTIVSRFPLEAYPPNRRGPWTAELWGGVVLASIEELGLSLGSVHSPAYSKRPDELPRPIDGIRRCHEEKVWEVELVAQELEDAFAPGRFIWGGDLNASLLFDEVYRRDANARLFANLAESGFHDLRPRFSPDEQRTFFRANQHGYQLDHVFADAQTEQAVRSWRVIDEPAVVDPQLSDHAPIEVLVDL